MYILNVMNVCIMYIYIYMLMNHIVHGGKGFWWPFPGYFPAFDKPKNVFVL